MNLKPFHRTLTAVCLAAASTVAMAAGWPEKPVRVIVAYPPGGVSDGHMPGSAHYEGRAVDVFFRPITPENQRQGWALAHYLVAHADRLELLRGDATRDRAADAEQAAEVVRDTWRSLEEFNLTPSQQIVAITLQLEGMVLFSKYLFRLSLDFP